MKMGSVYSINHTIMAQSIIGYKFRTNCKLCLRYCTFYNKWFIDKWRPISNLINPELDSFDLEITSSIEFMITNVSKTNNEDKPNESIIHVYGTIMNNIPINTIGHCRQSKSNKNLNKTYFSPIIVKNINHPKMPKIKDKILITKGIEADLSTSFLNIEIPRNSDGNYNYNGKIIITEGVLGKI